MQHNTNTNQTQNVPLNLIDCPDPTNGRAALDSERVERLARELACQPLLHPITVRPTNGRFALIAGRHRLAAFARLGRSHITATIISASDLTAATLRLSENVSRSQLSPIEEAHQLAQLLELNPGGVDAVAADLARPTTWVLDRLEILDWPDSLRLAVHTKRIGLGAAKLLARIQPSELRETRIHDASTHGCSAATARLWLQTCGRDDPNAPPPPKFSSQVPEVVYETTVKVLCAGCAKLKPIEDTQLARWCNACLSMIENAQRSPAEMSPLLTPPVYDPPPPNR